MTRRTTIIFDGDDTLWKTHFLYEEAKTQAAVLLNEIGIKVDRDAFAQKVNEISVNIGNGHGFISSRFPTALTEAYKYFCQQQQADFDEESLEQLWKLGNSVATRPPILMPQARDVLKSLSAKYDCILYTLGDQKQQLYRLNAVSLAPYFINVFVVLRKDETTLLRILTELSLDPSLTWMIGNSARSDIEPALKLGLNCIWLHSEHWLFDDAYIDTSHVHEISTLDEIGPIIEARRKKEGG